MHRKLFATAAAMALTAVFTTAPSADANHSWGSYHWARSTASFTLKLGNNLTSSWTAVPPATASYLDVASADWSQSTVLDTKVVPGSTSPKKCSPTAGMVQVCNAAYGQRGWLGIASIWANGSHITQGTVKLNDTYFNTVSYNKPEWRQFVVCQEVGHTFGLAHQNETFNDTNKGSCMDYTNDPSGTIVGQPSNEHPNDHDYAQLGTIYSHTDNFTTVAASAPSSTADGVGNSPAAWGTLVDGSRERGGVATYVRDLGNGNRVVTHVIWAN